MILRTIDLKVENQMKNQVSIETSFHEIIKNFSGS